MKRLALFLLAAAIAAAALEPRPVYLLGFDVPAPAPAPGATGATIATTLCLTNGYMTTSSSAGVAVLTTCTASGTSR
jgi:hypothetical protein